METTGCEREVKWSEATFFPGLAFVCGYIWNVYIYWMKITSNVIVIVINSIDDCFYHLQYSMHKENG